MGSDDGSPDRRHLGDNLGSPEKNDWISQEEWREQVYREYTEHRPASYKVTQRDTDRRETIIIVTFFALFFAFLWTLDDGSPSRLEEISEERERRERSETYCERRYAGQNWDDESRELLSRECVRQGWPRED